MEDVIRVQHLVRVFGKKEALSDVNLTIPRGEIYGLIGANGAGKTTLMRHLLGLLKAQRGSVRVFGADPIEKPVPVLRRIGYVSEDCDLPDWMRVSDLAHYTRCLYPTWDQAYAEVLRKKFELDVRQRVNHLSHGQRRRLSILLAEAHRPDLLILDEPAAGLDPVVRQDIIKTVLTAVSTDGRTVFLSSHLLNEVERVAGRIAMIHSGKIILDDSLGAIKQTHRSVDVRFDKPRETLPDLPGSYWIQSEAENCNLISHTDSVTLRTALHKLGAKIVGDRAATLDEVMLMRLRAEE